MIAFAGNSLLARLAFTQTTIDAATFTTVRLVSGALLLCIIVHFQGRREQGQGDWRSALALFGYAAGFSFAYLTLTAATGALLLFASVQATMIGYGLWTGERLRMAQTLGLVVALEGLVFLLLPGVSAPPPFAALLMVGAGVAWGVYSLRGRGAGNPTKTTMGNFVRAVPITLTLSLLTMGSLTIDYVGFGYAVASGALASGVGYAIWYAALPALRTTHAATVQLSVPMLAAVGGTLLLGEPVTLRLVVASVAVLGGIALVLRASDAAEGQP